MTNLLYKCQNKELEDTMSVESDLRKDGIKVIDILDTMTVNRIAHNIATKLCETFQNFVLMNQIYLRNLLD